MERRICLFILLLLTGISAAFTAHAQMGYVSAFTAGGDGAVLSVAVSAGELYFLYDGKVYALAKEGEAPQVKQADTSVPLFDTTVIHARSAAEFALQK